MKKTTLKIIALTLALLAIVIIAVPAFAGNAAPQMDGCYRCTHCGCSFSNEKKWNKHKDKCFSEVSLPEEPEETTAAVEEITETTTETVETTETTTDTTTTTVVVEETTTVPSTAVEETTTVAETTTENVVIVPETKPEPPVVEETETTTETTTTTVPSTVVEKTTAAVVTTTAPVTSTTKVTTTEKEAPVVKVTLPDIPEFKLPKLEIPEKAETKETTVETTVTAPDKFLGDDIDDSDIETIIPNTGSPKFVAGIAVLAIMAGAVMLVISKKNKNENNA